MSLRYKNVMVMNHIFDERFCHSYTVESDGFHLHRSDGRVCSKF
jgi:hypothetical protein